MPNPSILSEASEALLRARVEQQNEMDSTACADEKTALERMHNDLEQDGGMSRSTSSSGSSIRSTGSASSSRSQSRNPSPSQREADLHHEIQYGFGEDMSGTNSDDEAAIRVNSHTGASSKEEGAFLLPVHSVRSRSTLLPCRSRNAHFVWTARKQRLVTLGMTAAITIALSLYFHIFSTLFVFLAWISVGLPFDLAFDYMPRKETTKMHHAPRKTFPSRLSFSIMWLLSRIGRGVGIYAWLWAMAAWMQQAVLPADTPILGAPKSNSADIAEIPSVPVRNTSAPIFIASNLYNSAHLFPRFTENLLELTELLGGPASTYVSIYESNSNDDNATYNALRDLEHRLDARNVSSRIVTGVQTARHIGVEGDANARIEMLANVRNAAMKPLEEGVRGVDGRPFQYVLWLNDVVFDPLEIVELLHTNNGVFDAACAFDFMPLGLYDTWVTRDINGNRAKPLWPYFAATRDVQLLEAGQPILVDSCWNGAIAFDARWFTDSTVPARNVANKGKASNASAFDDKTQSSDPLLPLRFRNSHRCLSSECLLTSLDMHRALRPFRPWIFMNPKVAVAYDSATYRIYHDVMRSPLVRLWHFVWERFVSSTLFAWLTDKGRKLPACRGAFHEDWAGPEVKLDASRWQV